MSTRFELPRTDTHAGEYLMVNPTETGYLWDPGTGPVSFFVQEDAVSLPQRPRLNFINFFNLADNALNVSTDVDLDVVAIANDATFVTTLVANNSFTTQLANNNNFITNLTSNATFITNIVTSSGVQTGLQFQDEGVNLGTSGTADTLDFVGTGITATRIGNTVTVTVGSGSSQAGIQFQDEGVNLGTSGTVDTTDFVGAGVTATRIGNTLTVTIPGSSVLTIQDDGVALPNEPALNFVNYFTLTNNAGVANDVNINVTELGGDATFVTTVANNATFVTQLTSNVSFQTAVNTFVNASGVVQAGLQFQDEGVNLGAPATVDEIDFVGAGVTATRAANKVTVTIPSSSSAAEKKVGVGDIADINWFNIQIPFSAVNTTDPEGNVWERNGIVGNNPSMFTLSGTGDRFNVSSDQGGLLPDTDGTILAFSSGKQAIFQHVAVTRNIIGDNEGGSVFADTGQDITGLQGSIIVSVGFIRDSAGQWYARTADNTSFTETAIAIPTGKHVFRCEYDPGNITPQARFYVDGVLLATITTTIPTGEGESICFTAGNASGANPGAFNGAFTCPNFAVEV